MNTPEEIEAIAKEVYAEEYPGLSWASMTKGTIKEYVEHVATTLRIAEERAWKDASKKPKGVEDVQVVVVGYYDDSTREWRESKGARVDAIKWRELPTPPRKEGGAIDKAMAMPQRDVCPKCSGKGKLRNSERKFTLKCYDCFGKGWIERKEKV